MSAALTLPARVGAVRLGRHRGLILAAIVFAVLVAIISTVSAVPLGYYDFASLSASGATLAIATLGQTIVVLSGGFDLSAAAVVSLVNVVLATISPDGTASVATLIAVGVGIGVACGAVNGFFIAVLRMQPIVVTLSMMFILQGVTLLVMEKPGGAVPVGLSELFLGELVPNAVPMPVALVGLLLLLWYWLKRTRLGTAIYAIGSDAEAARAAGVRTTLVRFLVYVIAGGCYGFAGVFISAQTGAGDPLVGNPMLLQMFAAVVVGGTMLGGGRGGLTGSVLGAYILMIVVNILLVLNVSAYYSTIAESGILILAVLGASLDRASPLARSLGRLATRLRAWRNGLLPGQRGEPAKRLALPPLVRAARTKAEPGFLVRNAETLRYALPAYVCFAAMILATELFLGNAAFSLNYYNSLIVLSCFLVVLALGQGTVILTGGLDLSVPWTIGLCGILLAGLVKGSDVALVYALPAVLLLGLLIGFVNGVGIVVLGLSPIVMTLAMNGVLQGAALIYSNGTPDGFSSPMLRAFMTSRDYGITPVVPFVFLFVAAAVLLLGRTAFGRRVYGVGNSQRVAALSGVSVGRTLIGVYMLSGVCAALVGILLTGFSGQGSLGMGDDYLLPSIAVVVVGGALIAGGRGHYLGMVGGVLLLTALQTMLAGSTVPYATRAILFGVVILGAVLALRDRQS